ncbi:hypothetical protein D6D24_06647 [Aureobasidium pullulans]|uniref:Uncharacterized protein n=1 Tax=Aureobasidium pullulans TaxID=5580 RepID=A0A4S8VLD9_AURPU|nr:hypothetical protein D6D24_06647 [Aureobasidium pullulans]
MTDMLSSGFQSVRNAYRSTRNSSTTPLEDRLEETSNDLEATRRELKLRDRQLLETERQLQHLKIKAASLLSGHRAREDGRSSPDGEIRSLYAKIEAMARKLPLRTPAEMMQTENVLKELREISWHVEDGSVPALNSISLFEGILGNFIGKMILTKGHECCGIRYGRELLPLLKTIGARNDEVSDKRTADILDWCEETPSDSWQDSVALMSLVDDLKNDIVSNLVISKHELNKHDWKSLVQRAVKLSVDLYRLNIKLELTSKDYVDERNRMYDPADECITTSSIIAGDLEEGDRYQVCFVRQPGFRKLPCRNATGSAGQYLLKAHVLVSRYEEAPDARKRQ